MKRSVTLLMGIALLAALPASADFQTIDQAHEVPFQNLGLPGSAYGTMTFRECAECSVIILRATPATTYTLNGEFFELRAFSVELQRIRSKAIAEENVVTVMQNLATGTLLSITVQL